MLRCAGEAASECVICAAGPAGCLLKEALLAGFFDLGLANPSVYDAEAKEAEGKNHTNVHGCSIPRPWQYRRSFHPHHLRIRLESRERLSKVRWGG